MAHARVRALNGESFGARLRRLRLERGLSEAALARAAGIQRAAVSKIELGYTSGKRHREAFARCLGVDLFYLEYGLNDAVYVLWRYDENVEIITAFRDEIEADEWARVCSAAEGVHYYVDRVAIDDSQLMKLYAAERLAEPVSLPTGGAE